MGKFIGVLIVLSVLFVSCKDESIGPETGLSSFIGHEYWRGHELNVKVQYNIEVIKFENDTLLSSYIKSYNYNGYGNVWSTPSSYYTYRFNPGLHTFIGKTFGGSFMYLKQEGDSLRYYLDSTWTKPIYPALHRVN